MMNKKITSAIGSLLLTSICVPGYANGEKDNIITAIEVNDAVSSASVNLDLSGKDIGVNEKDFPQGYFKVKEDLVIFKDGNFKAYNGGPIEKENRGAQWVIPIVFEDTTPQAVMPLSVYEVAFVGCTPKNANGLKVFYVSVNDIDVKFRNCLNNNYQIFSSLINGNYKDNSSYIVIRKTDVAMVTFPDVYVDELIKDKSDQNEDLERILSFLSTKHFVQPGVTHVQTYDSIPPIQSLPAGLGQQTASDSPIFAPPIEVQCKIGGGFFPLYVTKVFMSENLWKLYYIVSNSNDLSSIKKHKIFVRADSGCVSGQIYDDNSCDCADQCYDYVLKHVATGDGILIQIPGHDGRGFGFAPKAETEIYKQGGVGKINTTGPMDTIAAAKFLYTANDNNYDIRGYKGVAQILIRLGCDNIILYTDSRRKVESLLSGGINVERVQTETNKLTCINHINAKKNNELFFNDSIGESDE
jgi:GTP cyclohydrolase II